MSCLTVWRKAGRPYRVSTARPWYLFYFDGGEEFDYRATVGTRCRRSKALTGGQGRYAKLLKVSKEIFDIGFENGPMRLHPVHHHAEADPGTAETGDDRCPAGEQPCQIRCCGRRFDPPAAGRGQSVFRPDFRAPLVRRWGICFMGGPAKGQSRRLMGGPLMSASISNRWYQLKTSRRGRGSIGEVHSQPDCLQCRSAVFTDDARSHRHGSAASGKLTRYSVGSMCCFSATLSPISPIHDLDGAALPGIAEDISTGAYWLMISPICTAPPPPTEFCLKM